MYEVELFLGFPVDSSFADSLAKVEPQVFSVFLQKDYLHQVTYKGQKYLGKFAGQLNHLHELDLLSANIYSLLRKIVADYPYQDDALVLFPITTPHE